MPIDVGDYDYGHHSISTVSGGGGGGGSIYNNSSSSSSSSSSAHSSTASPSKPNPSIRFLSVLLKFVIMALIISLFLLFLGIATVALLHIFVAGGVLHRRRHRSFTTAFFPSASPPSAAGYSPEYLQKFLPRFQYAAVSQEDCAVCLEGLRKGQWCRCLPNCNHTFHENCVDNWLIKVPNCPICRTTVQLGIGEASC